MRKVAVFRYHPVAVDIISITSHFFRSEKYAGSEDSPKKKHFLELFFVFQETWKQFFFGCFRDVSHECFFFHRSTSDNDTREDISSEKL